MYGTATYADLVALCESAGKELGLDVEVRQTDHEGELIGWVHEAGDAGAARGAERGRAHPLLLRADGRAEDAHRAAGRGAHLQHRGAARAVPAQSVITPVADGIIAGFGFQSYALALRAVAALLDTP